MQTADCTVLLGGDLLNTVHKEGVTPAEMILLKAIHGEESIKDIDFTGMDKRSHAEERKRLETTYKDAKDTKDQSVFYSIFPSPLTSLPVDFKEIGIGVESKKRGRPKKEDDNNAEGDAEGDTE